jgi:nucleotide-binding universal stress UspA family protein
MEPGLALEEASRNSDLVVVGARGANVLERAVLGSVSRTVLHHAACPVAVVRH